MSAPSLGDTKGRPVYFKYTAAVETILTVPCSGGPEAKVCVIGDPENAAYEWVHFNATGDVLNHSDAGYGCADVALRDGLIAQSGGPLVEVVEMLVTQFKLAGISGDSRSHDPSHVMMARAELALSNFKRGA